MPLLSLVMSPVQAAGLMLPVHVVSDIGGLLAGYTSFVSHSGVPPWQVHVQPLRLIWQALS